MAAIRIIDDHVQLASIGSKTHAAIEGHIQGIGNYAFPAADGGADQVLKTNGAGVLAWIDKNHSIASHNDTSATGAQLDTLVDNSIADALHRHSELVASDGSPDPALKVDAAGKVGIGIIAPEAIIHSITSSYVLVPKFERTSSSTLARLFSARFKSKTTDDMIDGFGSGLVFSIQDNAGVENDIAQVAAIRNGADNSGALVFVTYSAGSAAERMRIDSLGRIGINTTTPAMSALLDLTSTTGALLLSRMTTAQRDALTAVNGMLLYNSTLNKFQGYENGAWTSLI